MSRSSVIAKPAGPSAGRSSVIAGAASMSSLSFFSLRVGAKKSSFFFFKNSCRHYRFLFTIVVIQNVAAQRIMSSANLPTKPAGHRSSPDLPAPVIALRCRSGRAATVIPVRRENVLSSMLCLGMFLRLSDSMVPPLIPVVAKISPVCR